LSNHSLACRNPSGVIRPLILLLEQAFTACGLSFLHVSPSALLSSPLTPEPEANVCPILHSSFSTTVSYLSPLSFFPSSQIGKVRQASPSICPDAASPSTTRADPRSLVFLPRRVHNAAVRSSLIPSSGGPPLFPNLYALIDASPLMLGYRSTQCGKRRKRSVSYHGTPEVASA
jgi:hypothetical protein